MHKENRRKPSVFAGFLAGAEGLVSAAASVGPGRSPPGCRPPRHAPQAGLRANLAAKSFRSLTKKSGTARAIPDFFGRGRRTWSPLRSGRLVACVPPARTRPSARGFGVDVETAHREWGRGGVARFLLQDENVRCWFGAFRFSRSKTRIESPLEISLRMSSLKSYICMYTEE